MNTEKNTLTKAEIIEHLMENVSMTRQEARFFVEKFFGVLSDNLTKGYQVKISGFGNFEVRQKSKRPGRNPKTGEAVDVTARRVVTFKAGQKMRRLVADNLAS